MSHYKTKAELQAEKAALEAKSAKLHGQYIGQELKGQGKQAVGEIKKTVDLASEKVGAKATELKSDFKYATQDAKKNIEKTAQNVS